jgi:hypothetical protein
MKFSQLIFGVFLLFHFKLFSLARSGLFTLSHFNDSIQQGPPEDHEPIFVFAGGKRYSIR